MVLSLGYRRPDHVDKEDFRQSYSSSIYSDKEDNSLKSGRSNCSTGVPTALTFDKILMGGTCPPMTIRDFMNYLIYVEHSAENLQFFLWHRNYVTRFQGIPETEKALAPEWTQAMEDDTVAKMQRVAADIQKKLSQPTAEMFKGTDFEKSPEGMVETKDPFTTPPHSPRFADDTSTLFSASGSGADSQQTSYRSQASEAFAAAGAKQPFTIQPFRAEIDRVIATYLTEDAPRQLNMSSREQKATMQALAYTTHPSAFRLLAKSVENTLRRQAHPNFVRWSICNGNPARVCLAKVLGWCTVLLATVGAIILTLSRAGRGYRALFAIGWIIGVTTLVAGYKGMCVVMHGVHHRHIRPWELFVEDDVGGGGGEELGGRKSKWSFETFGTANSYEQEPWVVKYEKRNFVRRIFDPEVWIQEPALRQIQDTIFVQSVLLSLVAAAVLTAVFVAVPGGHFF